MRVNSRALKEINLSIYFIFRYKVSVLILPWQTGKFDNVLAAGLHVLEQATNRVHDNMETCNCSHFFQLKNMRQKINLIDHKKT